jgi:hypothetical protein
VTVRELIEMLRHLPPEAELMSKPIGKDGKIIVVVEGYELDPIFQITTRGPEKPQ